MKVLVISGFLGAGKTTFIKRLMKSSNREYVIFENEFGDVNIDGEILKKTVNEGSEKEENNIWELSSGCACCSTKADFMSSLMLIDNTLNPDFLIVEPSGIAFLSNILYNVKKTGYERIQLLPPVTIIDVQTYFKYKNRYSDIFIDQIEVSGHIQLSKTKNMSSEELKAVYDDLRLINSTAVIHTDDYYESGIAYWENLFKGEAAEQDSEEIKSVEKKMQNLTLKNTQIRDVLALLHFLNKVIFNYYGEINRGKGVFKAADHNIHFDLTDKSYSIYFSKEKVQNNIVLIGPHINKELLITELENLKKE